jgi:hypothetical protein
MRLARAEQFSCMPERRPLAVSFLKTTRNILP